MPVKLMQDTRQEPQAVQAQIQSQLDNIDCILYRKGDFLAAERAADQFPAIKARVSINAFDVRISCYCKLLADVSGLLQALEDEGYQPVGEPHDHDDLARHYKLRRGEIQLGKGRISVWQYSQ